MTLGEEIKRLAEKKGFTTQKALAEASGLSQPFVARLYSGDRPNLSAEVLYKLADALGVNCDHFRPFMAPSQNGAAKAATARPAKNRKKK